MSSLRNSKDSLLRFVNAVYYIMTAYSCVNLCLYIFFSSWTSKLFPLFSSIHFQCIKLKFSLKLFGITDEAWRKFTSEYLFYKNRGPPEAFYHNPTPFGDIFDTPMFVPKSTRTKIKFLKVTVLKRTLVPEILATEDCYNNQAN